MDSKTKNKDFDLLLESVGLAPSKIPEFYIFKFEDIEKDILESGSRNLDLFEISFYHGYDIDLLVEHEKKSALENNLCFVSPNQLFNWNLKKRNSGSYNYTIFFRPELLPYSKGAYSLYKMFPFFNRNIQSIYRLSKKHSDFVVNLLEKIYYEHKNFNEDSLQLIISYLNILLINCKRELRQNHYLIKERSRAEEISYQFESLVQNSVKSKQVISFYANKLNISEVYLSECVKKTTKKTAKQIIDEYLIIEAKSVLKHSNKSIAQISIELGFDDNSNFGKYFKKHTGMTPLEFQNT
ncbi:MAG: helix-turn-helix domain-containing protein [Rhodothermaceae bacterium]